MKKVDIRTYDDYISLKNNSTYPFLMISELIDNSISSFDNHYPDGEWGEKLIIEIDFYFNKNNTKTIHGTKAETESYIKVTDNAYGMSEEVLIDAVRLNKKNTTSLSTKNRHGRGLKQCAFYFGADLEIETWNDKNEISNIKLCTSLFNPSDEVHLETIRLDESDLDHLEKRGTSIIINQIYSNKSFTELKYEKLINSISHRYIKLIESGKMEIWYTKDLQNQFSTFERKDELDEFVAKVNDNFQYSKEKTLEIIKESENEIKEILESKSSSKAKRFGANHFPKFKSVVNDATKNISELLLKSIEDSEIDFIWEQTVDINGKSLPVKFWKLQKNKSRYRGYRVYEGDRALLHPPMSDDEGGTTTYHKSVFPSSSETGSSENRFAGEFDILNIDATTSTDKSKFIFDNSDDEEVLNNVLAVVWRVFNTFEMRGRSDVSQTEGKEISKKETQQVASVLKSKFGNSVEDIYVKVDDENNEVGLKMNLDKKNKWEIVIKIDNRTSPQKIWDREIDQFAEIPKMIITSFSAHPIWRRMDITKEFISESLIPISLFIAHYEIMNILDGTSGGSIADIDISKISSPIDMMNKSGEIIDE